MPLCPPAWRPQVARPEALPVSACPDAFRLAQCAWDAWDAARPAAMAGASLALLAPAADAEKSVAPAPDARELDALQSVAAQSVGPA